MTLRIELGEEHPSDSTIILINDLFTLPKEYLIESDAWKILVTLHSIVKREFYYQEILEIIWDNFDGDMK